MQLFYKINNNSHLAQFNAHLSIIVIHFSEHFNNLALHTSTKPSEQTHTQSRKGRLQHPQRDLMRAKNNFDVRDV